jgi:hypothetical protein
MATDFPISKLSAQTLRPSSSSVEQSVPLPRPPLTVANAELTGQHGRRHSASTCAATGDDGGDGGFSRQRRRSSPSQSSVRNTDLYNNYVVI